MELYSDILFLKSALWSSAVISCSLNLHCGALQWHPVPSVCTMQPSVTSCSRVLVLSSEFINITCWFSGFSLNLLMHISNNITRYLIHLSQREGNRILVIPIFSPRSQLAWGRKAQLCLREKYRYLQKVVTFYLKSGHVLLTFCQHFRQRIIRNDWK